MNSWNLGYILCYVYIHGSCSSLINKPLLDLSVYIRIPFFSQCANKPEGLKLTMEKDNKWKLYIKQLTGDVIAITITNPEVSINYQ